MSNNTIIHIAEVKSVEDEQGGLRIKAFIAAVDRGKTVDELPYCFPLLPKHLNINPKVGECVLVVFANAEQPQGIRFFVGPLISQQYGIGGEPFFLQARCLLPGIGGKPYPNPSMNPENEGGYPEREVIAFQGRGNSDVLLMDNELRLRCGHKKTPDAKSYQSKLAFNREDLGYIQMKYKKRIDETGRDYYSSVNVVADRINLLSHDSTAIFNMSDNKELITDEEMAKILKEAHPMIYGDDLIRYLRKLIDVIRTHTHPFSMDPPCFSDAQKNTLNEPLEDMLSTSIKFN